MPLLGEGDSRENAGAITCRERAIEIAGEFLLLTGEAKTGEVPFKRHFHTADSDDLRRGEG